MSVRKVLIGFVGLIILAFAAVLIVPGFIDWNTYKNDITNQVASLTGRQLTIDGNIEMTVLPAPAITVNDVSFANAAGADVPHMVRLKSLEVRIALGPLLSGDIQVQKVRIVDPVVLLEILPDGQPNWAVEISMERIFAWAWGERKTTPCAIRGKTTSSTKLPCPRKSL